MSDLHDAYGHVALPRFLSGGEFLNVMEEHGVGRALVCTAETCPDLAELSKTACRWPDRFLVAGLPLGSTPHERIDGVRAQLDAGFCGIRIPESRLLEEPALLDAVGQADGILLVVGSDGLKTSAAALAGWLERYPAGLVLAPHFASGGDPGLFDSSPVLAPLYAHPRFGVIASRQGMFPRDRLIPWLQAVHARVGPDRLLWGSEYPVALYRDESYADTMNWIEDALPMPEYMKFRRDNADRLIFAPRKIVPKPLAERWCRMDLKSPAPVWLFPHGTLDVPEEANRAMLEAYLRAGGDRRESYRAFVARRLAGDAVR